MLGVSLVSSDTSRLCLIGFPLKASEHSIKRALRNASKGEIRHLELLKHTWNDEQIVVHQTTSRRPSPMLFNLMSCCRSWLSLNV